MSEQTVEKKKKSHWWWLLLVVFFLVMMYMERFDKVKCEVCGTYKAEQNGTKYFLGLSLPEMTEEGTLHGNVFLVAQNTIGKFFYRGGFVYSPNSEYDGGFRIEEMKRHENDDWLRFTITHEDENFMVYDFGLTKDFIVLTNVGCVFPPLWEIKTMYMYKSK